LVADKEVIDPVGKPVGEEGDTRHSLEVLGLGLTFTDDGDGEGGGDEAKPCDEEEEGEATIHLGSLGHLMEGGGRREEEGMGGGISCIDKGYIKEMRKPSTH